MSMKWKTEDKVENDNQFVQEMEDDHEMSEALIRAFSPQNDQNLDVEVQQVTKNQGLSER